MSRKFIQTANYYIVEYQDKGMSQPIRIFYSSKEAYENDIKQSIDYQDSEEYKKWERNLWYNNYQNKK